MEHAEGELTGGGYLEWKIENHFAKLKEICLNGGSFYSPDFIFEDQVWCLGLHKSRIMSYGYVDMFLMNYERRGFSTEYCLGVKTVDGKVDVLESGIIKGDEWANRITALIKIPDRTGRKEEMLHTDPVAFICSLKRVDTPIDEPLVLTTPPAAINQSNLTRVKSFHEEVGSPTDPISALDTSPTVLERSYFKCLEKLSENFKILLNDTESSDTILKVKNSEHKVHRAVLMARSSVFAAMFKHRTLEKQSGVIDVPDCDEESFKDFLQFVYCGKIENMSIRSAIHLYETSDKYDVQELKTICVDYLTQNLTVETVCEVAVLADMYEETELLSAVQLLFNEHAANIFGTCHWNRLMKDNNRLADKLLIEMSKAKLLK